MYICVEYPFLKRTRRAYSTRFIINYYFLAKRRKLVTAAGPHLYIILYRVTIRTTTISLKIIRYRKVKKKKKLKKKI